MIEIRAAGVGDREAIGTLVREMIPDGDAAARWHWLYESNPGGRALTWIARVDGELAGCTSYFPFRMLLDGAPARAALGGDGYVRPAFRRRGLGARLHDAARADLAANQIGCMYGAPGAMNLTPLKHGGSREIGHVARWARPLAGAYFDFTSAYLEPMQRDDPRVDEIWRAFAPTVRLSAVRDARFYTWRFLEAPSHQEPAYVIVEHGRPIAACAIERIGVAVRIVDLIAVPGRWHRALRAIARYVGPSGARTLDVKLMALDGRRRAMWRAGFFERDSKPFLVVIPRDGDRRYLDPMRWFYCGGDSDLDVLR